MPSQYKRLAKHPGIWRVDGIGEITFNLQNHVSADIYFSEIKENKLESCYKNDSLTSNTMWINYPVAALSEFKVGTVWREGKRIQSPDRVSGSFSIDTTNIKIIRLGEPFEINGRKIPSIIPLAYYEFGNNREHLESTYIAVLPVLNRNENIKWIFIPCSELFRFYLGGNSRLLSKSLIDSNLGEFIDWQASDPSLHNPKLHLKKKVTRSEAFIFLRALTSKHARLALATPHKYLATTNTKNKEPHCSQRSPLMIKSIFPFQGRTALTITGKKMFLLRNNDSSREWGVFAMSILNCSRHCDFVKPSIFYYGAPTPKGTGSSPDNGSTKVPDTPFLDESEDIDINGQPTDKRKRRAALIHFANSFSAMNGLMYDYQNLNDSEGTSGFSGGNETINDGSPADGDYSNDSEGNTGVDNQENNIDEINRDINHFVSMLKQLREKSKGNEWKIKTRALETQLVVDGELVTALSLIHI